MPQWTHTKAFKHFDTVPRNVQWSWSARNENTATVVVTLWQDQFRRIDGRLIYDRSEYTPAERRRPGFSELMKNLLWARDHCDSRFKVIIAKAKDVNAHPRSIDDCFPSNMIMRLIHLDTTTGAFTAEAEGM